MANLKWVKPGEMSEISGLSKRQLRDYARSGKIPKESWKLTPGGQFMYSPHEYDKACQKKKDTYLMLEGI